MPENKAIREAVKEAYARIAQESGSCCAPSSCGCDCGGESLVQRLGYSQEDLASAPESSVMGLGCGNPVAWAELREGEVVLDLGSGGGMDAFLAAARVGSRGRVIGVDMTSEMVSRAKDAAGRHSYRNVEFCLGEIEILPIGGETVDVVISNCVINLSTDKESTFREAHRVLRPGGRLVVSDIVSRGEIPVEAREDLASWAGCVAGAMEGGAYLTLLKEAGFREVLVLSQGPFYELSLPGRDPVQVVSLSVRASK